MQDPYSIEVSSTPVASIGCERAAKVAVLEQRVDVALSLTQPILDGRGEIRVRALVPTNVVQLDNLGLRVSSVSVAGKPLRFTENHAAACLQLLQPLAAGEELVLAVTWQVEPNAPGFTLYGDQVYAGARAAGLSPPRLEPDPRAPLKIKMTAAEGLTVVTSWPRMTFVEKGNDGVSRTTYDVSTQISPFLDTFAFGRFKTLVYYGQGFSLTAYGPQDADLSRVLELTLAMYQLLRDRTAARPVLSQYRQVFVHGDVAYSSPGLSLISESVLRAVLANAEDDRIIAHELAHQWFGLLVPCAEASEKWLSEGFATFMAGVIAEQRSGRPAYDRELAIWRAHSQSIAQSEASRLPVRPQPAAARTPESRTHVYYRGALVLDKLRHELGEETFWNGVRHYVATQAGKPTRTEDLQNAFATVSGRDLSAFFERWVYTGAPDL